MIVLAVSSGGGCNALQLDVKSFLSLDQICERVMFLPFTDDEVERFIRLHAITFNETTLKLITGNNPYLLSLAITCNNERDLQIAVAKNIEAFAKQNLLNRFYYHWSPVKNIFGWHLTITQSKIQVKYRNLIAPGLENMECATLNKMVKI